MRLEYVEPVGEVDSEGDTITDGSIDCPKCGSSWMRVADSSAWVVDETTCPHLRFAIEPDATSPEEIHYFNGMTAERLVAAVAKAYQRANPAAAEELNPEEAFGEALFDEDFWQAAVMDEIDALFDHTQEGIACGPVSHTALYGAKLEE